MPRFLEMLRGVLARRTIAAADVTAGEAEPQMKPAAAGLQALLATGGMRGRRGNALQVGAGHGNSPSCRTRGWERMAGMRLHQLDHTRAAGQGRTPAPERTTPPRA